MELHALYPHWTFVAANLQTEAQKTNEEWPALTLVTTAPCAWWRPEIRIQWGSKRNSLVKVI